MLFIFWLGPDQVCSAGVEEFLFELVAYVNCRFNAAILQLETDCLDNKAEDNNNLLYEEDDA